MKFGILAHLARVTEILGQYEVVTGHWSGQCECDAIKSGARRLSSQPKLDRHFQSTSSQPEQNKFSEYIKCDTPKDFKLLCFTYKLLY